MAHSFNWPDLKNTEHFLFVLQISDKMVKQMTKIAMAGAQGYLQVGWNIPLVAENVGRQKSVISRLAKKAREMGEERAMVRKPGVAGEIWQPLLTSTS